MLTAIAAMSIVLACVGIAVNLVYALPVVILAIAGSGDLVALLLSPLHLWFVEAAAWIGLAMYLFMAGVLLLSGKPSACRHHRQYAIGKIAVAAVLTFTTWPHGSFVARGLSVAPADAAVAARTLRFMALSLAYPAFLLFAMNTRGVREYDR